MGAKKHLERRLRLLEQRDGLRRQELLDTDAALAASDERHRRQRDLARALAERVYLAHEVLAHLAERRPVVLTETDYPTE